MIPQPTPTQLLAALRTESTLFAGVGRPEGRRIDLTDGFFSNTHRKKVFFCYCCDSVFGWLCSGFLSQTFPQKPRFLQQVLLVVVEVAVERRHAAAAHQPELVAHGP